MTIQQIYNLAIKMGIEADPRGRERVQYLLKKEKEKFKDLKPSEKEEFDRERFTNPYSDSRILFADPEKKVKRILVGIDIDPAEILLADRLNQKGEKIDLVLAHHPSGQALACLDDVLRLQTDLLADLGIPINIAENLLEIEIEELGRKLSPLNHTQTVDTAKLLGLPLICIHTPTDNLVYQYLKNYLEKKNPDTVGELVKILKLIPEYKKAMVLGAGPKIFAGKPERRCGKIALTEITGGTAGSKNIYEKLSHIGVGTVVGMHMKEEHKNEAQKYHLNVVITGHISSDSLGLNLFLDQLEAKGIEIIPCSGLIRIKRKK